MQAKYLMLAIYLYTFRWNNWLHGLHPYGFHVINVFLHMLVTALFTHLCHMVVFPSKLRPTILAGVLFAVHPIHTEAVSTLYEQFTQKVSLFTSWLLGCTYAKYTLRWDMHLGKWRDELHDKVNVRRFQS